MEYGGGATRPYRISLISVGPTDDSEYLGNHARAIKRGLPELREQQPLHDRTLAVVGGGPSVADHLEELRTFDEVWGINGTANWLIERGIDATFYSVDPAKEVAGLVGKAKRGIVVSGSNPATLDALESPSLFFIEVSKDDNPIFGGCTSATRAPMLALRLGFKTIHYFGCDGSFKESTHIDRNEARDDLVIIRAGEKDYLTAPDLLLQTQELAGLMIQHPEVYKCRSGGLLPAIIEHWETWEWAAVSEKYRDKLRETNNDQTMFSADYKGATCSL